MKKSLPGQPMNERELAVIQAFTGLAWRLAPR